MNKKTTAIFLAASLFICSSSVFAAEKQGETVESVLASFEKKHAEERESSEKLPRIDSNREMAEEIARLREDLYAVSESQTELLDILNTVKNRLKDMERVEEYRVKAIAAPTARALVYPNQGNGGSVSYTQDAINSQGNSTMVFTYSPEQLYKIYCRRGYLTDLAFKKGETISFVGGGDTAGWSVSTTTVDGTPHLYIKPVVETSTTNLIVTTNKRSYQLILNTSDWYNPMVSWSYGAEDLTEEKIEKQRSEKLRTGQLGVTAVENLDFSYKCKGSGEYLPERVFSDGQKVYFQFKSLPRHQVPLFVQEKGKKGLTLVTYTQKDNYYICEVPFKKAQLRVGENEIITILHEKGE